MRSNAELAPVPAIPWDKIDPEIRPLIQLMNAMPGIRTEDCCVGHDDGQEGYVSFRAESQDALLTLLRCLPESAVRRVLHENRYEWSAALVTAEVFTGKLGFRLSLRASELFVQRQLLAEIEKALREQLAR